MADRWQSEADSWLVPAPPEVSLAQLLQAVLQLAQVEQKS